MRSSQLLDEEAGNRRLNTAARKNSLGHATGGVGGPEGNRPRGQVQTRCSNDGDQNVADRTRLAIAHHERSTAQLTSESIERMHSLQCGTDGRRCIVDVRRVDQALCRRQS